MAAYAPAGSSDTSTASDKPLGEALGGRLEIITDFGDQRLAFTEPGTEAA
jgi:hypothetical protein